MLAIPTSLDVTCNTVVENIVEVLIMLPRRKCSLVPDFDKDRPKSVHC